VAVDLEQNLMLVGFLEGAKNKKIERKKRNGRNPKAHISKER
jgi:hypothetical protein